MNANETKSTALISAGDAPVGGLRVLTINAGSSSLKFAVFDPGDRPRRLLSGSIDRIGLSGAMLSVRDGDRPAETYPVVAADHAQGVDAAIEHLASRSALQHIGAVGHRVVHGGPRYDAPQKVTPELLDELRRISPLAPEHLPSAIKLIEVSVQRLGHLPQYACFDTAFHHTMPRVARLLAIPRKYEAQGVRRYGFHGLSYQYLIEELARVAGPKAARAKVILAHLGRGVSLAAVREGRSIDTSMAFTPTAGVPMGTRSGDIDPGLVRYLEVTQGMSAGDFHEMVNRESGLLGVSGISPDMRDLLQRQATDAAAADAVNLFCYQIRKWIGSFAAALGGVDTLVFAGGIGEHSPEVRALICQNLEFLGIQLNPNRNQTNAPIISFDHTPATVRVIPTDEESMIAKLVYGLID